jgi:hypothetical protein
MIMLALASRLRQTNIFGGSCAPPKNSMFPHHTRDSTRTERSLESLFCIFRANRNSIRVRASTLGAAPRTRIFMRFRECGGNQFSRFWNGIFFEHVKNRGDAHWTATDGSAMIFVRSLEGRMVRAIYKLGQKRLQMIGIDSPIKDLGGKEWKQLSGLVDLVLE